MKIRLLSGIALGLVIIAGTLPSDVVAQEQVQREQFVVTECPNVCEAVCTGPGPEIRVSSLSEVRVYRFPNSERLWIQTKAKISGALREILVGDPYACHFPFMARVHPLK